MTGYVEIETVGDVILILDDDKDWKTTEKGNRKTYRKSFKKGKRL